MTAEQFWTVALIGGVAVLAAIAVRAALRRLGGVRDGVTGLRDRAADVAARLGGPVNLEVLPDVLVDRAVGAARPIPGGRALPTGYRLRCGPDLYEIAFPHLDVVEQAFRAGLRRAAAENGWAHREPTFAVELDESLPPRVHRFETSFPRVPTANRKVTDVLPAPQTGETTVPLAGGAEPGRALSAWVLALPDGRRMGVPADTTFTIGAGPDCDVVVPDDYVSGVHATVTARGVDLVVKDGDPAGKRSTNGTRVDNHKITTVVLTPDVDRVEIVLGGRVSVGVERRVAAPRRVR